MLYKLLCSYDNIQWQTGWKDRRSRWPIKDLNIMVTLHWLIPGKSVTYSSLVSYQLQTIYGWFNEILLVALLFDALIAEYLYNQNFKH